MNEWHPTSWQRKVCLQQPHYPSKTVLTQCIDELSLCPGLVTPMEINSLKAQIASAAKGRCFLLQGGDCAESFAESDTYRITAKLKILLQMSLVLLHGLRIPIIRVGRIAGQYAKPRSSDVETINHLTLPSYRGDLINQANFSLQARTPDPKRMLMAYHKSALTLNYIRAMMSDGFADLHHPEHWALTFAKQSPSTKTYQQIAHNISSTLSFLQTISGTHLATLTKLEYYTSHEALLLPYEQALTRQTDDSRWYNLGTHFPWLGMRTADIDQGHVEYLRGISNPIAIKVGPDMHADHLIKLIEQLNPTNEPGKITLIHRMGSDIIAKKLPSLIQAVNQQPFHVLWSCDPMHGNTKLTRNNIKTRRFEDILSELQQAFEIHTRLGSHLGGVHFEMTGENVTECTGGARGLTEDDLKQAYKTLVDPRLNYEQSLEMAMLIVAALPPSSVTPTQQQNSHVVEYQP